MTPDQALEGEDGSVTSDAIDKVARAIKPHAFMWDRYEVREPPWAEREREEARGLAIAALRAIHPTLEAARDEILWWRDEHPCCAGHETEALDAINQVLEANPNTGREG